MRGLRTDMRGGRWMAYGVVGALALGAAPAALARTSRTYRPQVVVAVADSGVNPYHQAFYRPQNTAHPCTWVKGLTDCSMPALNLSVGKYTDYAAAVAADRAVWKQAKPHTWYWIPRTNIIGAVCDVVADVAPTGAPPSATCILDDDGHGTGTAFSVLSEEPDALLLIHDGDALARDMSSAPVTPDLQSHSWGADAPLPFHAARPANAVVARVSGRTVGDICPEAVRRRETVFFLAAGNKAPFPTFADCARQDIDVNVVGGGYPGYWEAGSWSAFDFASWYCRPLAVHDSTTAQFISCGTSFSAPTATGAAAAALLRIRRSDGYTGRSTGTRVSTSLTRKDFVAALRAGASYSPKAKYQGPIYCLDPLKPCMLANFFSNWVPLAPGTEHVFWGYGWLDSTVVDAVVGCAQKRACPAKSAAAVAWNDARQSVRGAFDVTPPPAQPDAGTQRDAGVTRSTAIAIRPRTTYSAHLEPFVAMGDTSDWYTFAARASERITVTASASLAASVPLDPSAVAGCWTLQAPAGSRVGAAPRLELMTPGCDTSGPNGPPHDVVAPATGTYVLAYTAHNGLPPHDYTFSLALDR